MPKHVDYSVYLVTDSTPAILGERDLVQVVEDAIKGGVTIVQLREKSADTGALLETARRVHAVTKRHGVPLLINDRVDVALAIGCEGAHVGQDDMDLETARKLLGADAIIGVSAGNIDEAVRACQGGADYLGIGTVYATATKTNTKDIIGTAGVRKIIDALVEKGHHTPSVCIGGINETNAQRILFQSRSNRHPESPEGIAVVSAIMAAEDPGAAATRLAKLVRGRTPFEQVPTGPLSEVMGRVPGAVKAVHDKSPLTHNMTNLVVQNFAANVALAIGASPIMANYAQEAPDLCKLKGSLVINMGTVDPDGLANHVRALKSYNMNGRPVVFDPVGAGATAVRRGAVRTIMAAGYLDVIKGNEGEIRTVFGSDDSAQQHGVDSSNRLSPSEKASLVRDLAARERNIVVMTGASDYVSDGGVTLRIDNGHEYLGMVTGTGCTLGTAISATVAVREWDKLTAVLAALLHFEIAAERAAERQEVRGPGTFLPAFLDELFLIRKETAASDFGWLSRGKVSVVEWQSS